LSISNRKSIVPESPGRPSRLGTLRMLVRNSAPPSVSEVIPVEPFTALASAAPNFSALLVTVALRPVLEHDPEKWNPVFGQDHAQIKELDSDQLMLNMI